MNGKSQSMHLLKTKVFFEAMSLPPKHKIMTRNGDFR